VCKKYKKVKMKTTALFIILLFGLTAYTQGQSENPTETISYSESELIAFLDSIGQLNPDAWIKELTFEVDSVLYNQTTLNHELTESDFEKLKKAIKAYARDEIMIDIDFAKRIFPKLEVTEFVEYNSKKVPIEFYSFDENEEDFKEFAIIIGYADGLCWNNDVYFFYNKKIIAKHSIFHRYGLELEHFKDENNKTVIFYRVNYGSGSGIWWHQYNFYQYNKDQLIPILTEIQNINLQFPWSIRAYWIESEIVNTKPLQLKFVYSNQFYDGYEIKVSWDFPTIDFINDSTIVTYRIDAESGKFIPAFNGTKLNKNKLLSYFLADNESLFVNAHYDLFKSKLNENETVMREAILNYLNNLKNTLKTDN